MRRIWLIAGLLGTWVVWGQTLLEPPTPYVFPPLFAFPPMPSNPTNPVTNEGAELGRLLFYDPILSRDSTIACASCHRQEAAFSDAPRAQSLGIGGQLVARNALPLFNLAWYERFFWDGRAATLEELVFHPVRDAREMDLPWAEAETRLRRHPRYVVRFREAFGDKPIDSVLVSKAIGQFLRTIISNRTRYDRALRGEVVFTTDEWAGFVIANEGERGACLGCHPTDAHALGTSGGFSNNGLNPDHRADAGLGAVTQNPRDVGRFKIPSLRNLGFTAPYMHDGRFQTIEQVVDFYSEGGHRHSPNLDGKMLALRYGFSRLSPDEKRQLVAFLRTLNDSALVVDPRFSNPFTTTTPKK